MSIKVKWNDLYVLVPLPYISMSLFLFLSHSFGLFSSPCSVFSHLYLFLPLSLPFSYRCLTLAISGCMKNKKIINTSSKEIKRTIYAICYAPPTCPSPYFSPTFFHISLTSPGLSLSNTSVFPRSLPSTFPSIYRTLTLMSHALFLNVYKVEFSETLAVSKRNIV